MTEGLDAMDNFQRSSKNMFGAGTLDRVHDRHGDREWLSTRMRDPASLFVPVRESRIFVAEGDNPAPVLFKLEQLNGYIGEESIFFLGEDNGRSYFAVDLGGSAADSLAGRGRFRDLRAVAPLLSGRDGALLAYAKALVYWHGRNHFCGACGSRSEVREGGRCRACVNPDCGVVHFPRTDPAIIVMIMSGKKGLLARQRVWPERMYSVVAGFVEPGETAEGAVVREVFEEVGLRVGNIRYHSSQPWPFPCSLMLGFTAETEDDRISLRDRELEDARWFERAELNDAVRSGTVKLSTPVSISYRLIEDWFNSDNPLPEPWKAAERDFAVRKEE